MSASFGARRSALAFALLLLVPVLIVTQAPSVEAQRPGDPWWGPTDRNSPTEGWAVRVPVVVENDRGYTLFNHPVFVELDLTKLLVEAGWTSRAVLADRTLQGFTLDVDSIRVVEYGRGFASGPVREEAVPHAFYPALLEADRTRDFDATTNPAGTVAFAAPSLAPGEKRFYYVYANPLQYGKHEPADDKRADRAALDGLLWSTLGTVYYGYMPLQKNANHRLQIDNQNMESATVTFYQYSGGQATPVPSTTLFPNPMTISPFMTGTFMLPQANAPFKIESDNPVRVAVHGGTKSTMFGADTVEANGFAPGMNSFTGQFFRVYGFGISDMTGPVTVMRANDVGSVTVDNSRGQTVTLTGANPVQTIPIGLGWNTITASAPILVTHTTNAGAPFAGHAVPARTGGPVGSSFYSFLPDDGGLGLLCADTNATLRVLDLVERTRQFFPQGNRETTPAYSLVEDACHVFEGGSGYPSGRPIEVRSTLEPADPVGTEAGDLRFLVSAGARQGDPNGIRTRGFVGPFAGIEGRDYVTQGPTGLFGHYGGTKVTIVEEMRRGDPKVLVRSLARDTFLPITPSEGSTGRFHIEGNKPFTAVSLEAVEHFGAYLGGRPATIPIEVGEAEFRGPLVSLRFGDAEGLERTKDTGPETPVDFPVEISNLGRWVGGTSLPDTYRISCTDAPEGWVIEGCGREVRLESGALERLNIRITPGADDVGETRVITLSAESTTANVSASLKIRVKVTIVYGLDMRFFGEAGPRTIDPPVGLDPGATHTFEIFAKNTGSARDTFTFSMDEPRVAGWTQRLEHEGQVVDRITLDGGAATVLQFVVTAPGVETAGPHFTTITGQSVSSLAANAAVNPAARIRPNVDVRLTLDPPTQVATPGEAARFNLTLLNSGNDIFRILLNEEGVLPQGWTSELEFTEIDLGPGAPFVVGLFLTPPSEARAGDLATLKIAAEIDIGDRSGTIPGDEVGAVVVVRRVHNITTPALLDVETPSGLSLDLALRVQNAGNGEDTLEVLPLASSPPWRVTSRVGGLTLPTGDEGDLPLTIEVPGDAPPGPMNLTFVLRLSRESTQNITIPFFVEETRRVTFQGLEDLRLLPAQPRLVDVRVTNAGNVRAEFDLAAEAPDGWNVTFSPPRVERDPGERMPVVASFDASREAQDGSYTLRLHADPGSDVLGEASLEASLARPDLFVERVSTNGRPRAGDLLLVTASIGNQGDVAAENATVALVVDGVVVDSIVVSRVPVGEPRLATLSWLATGSPGVMTVVIDPENAMVELSRDQNVAQVEFASRIPLPALPILLALLGGLAIALRRWRA